MSFAYKTLKGSDISISPYIANKQYAYPSSELTSSGITVYTGEYIPQYIISGTVYNAFDPINDVKNNGYYRRLIFDSILKLYYQNWVSGSQSGVFYGSSSYDNYDQTTIASGTLGGNPVTKFLSLLTGSGGAYGTSPYDSSSYAVLENSKIRVISIPQDIYGNGIEPGTFVISSSTYFIKDDGQGNLWDYITSGSIYNNDPYNGAWYAGTEDTKIYVGNIVYSPGFAIITNEDYLCFYPSEPVALNDNYSILNVSSSKVLDILSNDFDDCNVLDDSTVTTYPLSGYTFPSFSIIGGEIHITDCGANNLQVTPGEYKILYTVNNDKGVTSNYATCSLTIISGEFTSSLISYTSGCWGDATSQSATFSLDLGVPPYSYSLDNTNWATLSSCALYQPSFSVLVPNDDNVNIYLKDSIGSLISYSLDVRLNPIVLNVTSQSTCPLSNTGWISASATIGNPVGNISASLDDVTFYPVPYVFTGLAANNYTVYFKDGANCTTASSATISIPPPILISNQSIEADCTGSPDSPNGGISVSVTGGSGTKDYRWWNGSSFVSFVEDPVGLPSGSYQLFVSDSTGCNNATSSITVIGTIQVVFNPGTIASSSCYGTGGGGSITGNSLAGGSGSLFPVWTGPNGFTSNSLNIINLFTGSYTLTITDSATGCDYIFGPYIVNEPTEFKSSSFTIDRVIGNGPYRARFAFQGGTLDTGGGYTASLFLSSSAGLSLQYIVTASSAATQQLLLTQSCLTASTNWVLFAEDDNGCQMTNFSPSYFIPLAPQVVQQTQVCYSTNTPPETNVCNCTVGSPTIFYLSSSFANSVTASSTILNFASLIAANGDPNALIWANCAQTVTASVGSYWDGVSQYADIGLASTGGWVNNYDPCAVPLVSQVYIDIVNSFGGKVTSQTTANRYFNSALTSSNYNLLSFNDTTSSSFPIPVNGFLELNGYADQALDPAGTVGVTIYITSQSSGPLSSTYTLYSGSIGNISGTYTTSYFTLDATFNYNVYVTYDSQYSSGGGGTLYCQDAFFGGGCLAYVGCVCPPGYTEVGCFQPLPC